MSVKKRWASQTEAAEYIGISPRTMRRWIAEGLVTGHRFGPRVIRIDLDDIDALARPVEGEQS